MNDDISKYFSYDHKSGDVRRIKKTNNISKVGHVYKSKNGCGYITVKHKSKTYQAHRLAWFLFYGEWPKDNIDHINGDRGDNRIVNLRVVSKSENSRNTKAKRTNKTGITGVCWHKRDCLWRAYILDKHIGNFKTLLDAASARISAQLKIESFHANHGRR